MKIINKICPNCNKEVRPCNFNRHYSSCTSEEKKPTVKEEYKVAVNQYKCPFCDKIYSKRGLGPHIWRKHGDGIWFTKNNDGYKLGIRKATNQFLKGTQQNHSKETRKKLSIRQIENPSGFCLNPLQRSQKRGFNIPYYDSFGQYCILESTWEFVLANNLDYNNIKWKRPWSFVLPGKQGYYTPDFYIPQLDVYLDPKALRNYDQDRRINIWLKHYKKKLIIIEEYNSLNWEYIKARIV